MIDQSNNRIQLSEAGQQRREQMLTELQGELKRRQVRRQHLNGFAAVAGAMLVIAIVTWALLVGTNYNDMVVDQTPPGSTSNNLADRHLNSAPRIAEYKKVVFETIDDEQMLQTLSELGCPAVLGRVGGELTIVRQTKM